MIFRSENRMGWQRLPIESKVRGLYLRSEGLQGGLTLKEFLRMTTCSYHRERPDGRAACCRMGAHAHRHGQNCTTHVAEKATASATIWT